MRPDTHGDTTNCAKRSGYSRSLAPVFHTGAGTVSPSFRDVLFLPYKFRASDSNKQFLLTLGVCIQFF